MPPTRRGTARTAKTIAFPRVAPSARGAVLALVAAMRASPAALRSTAVELAQAASSRRAAASAAFEAGRFRSWTRNRLKIARLFRIALAVIFAVALAVILGLVVANMVNERAEPAARPQLERPSAPRRAVTPPAPRRAETTPLPRATVIPPASRTPVTSPARSRAASPPGERPAETTPPRRGAAKPRTASTPARSRGAAAAPLTRAPRSPDALNLTAPAILAFSLLALVGVAALAWRFGLAGSLAPRGFDRGHVEIGGQVLVALVVSAIVGWLIATQFPT
jgi:hypothetical protein